MQCLFLIFDFKKPLSTNCLWDVWVVWSGIPEHHQATSCKLIKYLSVGSITRKIRYSKYAFNCRFTVGCCLHLPMPFSSNSVTLEETLIKIKIAEQSSRIALKSSQPWITLNWNLKCLMIALTSFRNALMLINSMTGKLCSKLYQCLQESWHSMICHFLTIPFMSWLMPYSSLWFSLSLWT